MGFYARVQYPKNPEEGIESPEAVVTGSCGLPDMGAWNRSGVL